MTEIRIYPSENLVAISKDVCDSYDLLDELENVAIDIYRDSDCIYYKVPMDVFMTEIRVKAWRPL